MNTYYGIDNVRDRYYGAVVALTYTVFKSRDRKGPVSGTSMWSVLQSRIANAAETSNTLEQYIQSLATGIKSWFNPKELARIVQPQQRIFRVSADGGEIAEFDSDEIGNVYGHRDLLVDIATHECQGFQSLDREGQAIVLDDIEREMLNICRQEAVIVTMLCNVKHQLDKALGQDSAEEEYIEVEVK